MGDIGSPDFHFQRRGYTVERLDALAGRFLAMLVQVNEARGHDQPCRVNDPPPAQRFGRDADDLAVAYSDVAYGVETGFRIHDSSALEHQIVLPRRDSSCRKQKKREDQLAHKWLQAQR